MNAETIFVINNAYRYAESIRTQIGLCVENKLEPKQALVSVGSLSKGDFSAESDLDLLLLGDSVTREQTASIESLISASLNQEASVQTISRGNRLSLKEFYFSHESRLVAGSVEIYIDWCKYVSSKCYKTSPRDLALLHEADPRRYVAITKPDSVFGRSIKRGAGGLVDFSYVALVNTYARRHNIELPRRFDEAKAIYGELVFLKLSIATTFGTYRDVIDACAELKSEGIRNYQWYYRSMQNMVEIVEQTKEQLNGVDEEFQRMASASDHDVWRTGICIFKLF